MSKKKKVLIDKKTIVKYPTKTSGECSKCLNQCIAGIRYIQHMSVPGRLGKGVTCKQI